MRTEFITSTLGKSIAVAILFLSIAYSSMAQTDFKAEWEGINNLNNQGMTKSALEKTQSLLEKARLENNQSQVLKGIFFSMYLASLVEEDYFLESISRMQQEIDRASQPNKSILHSGLAEMYMWYFLKNRWAIAQRTESEDADPLDVRTWTLRQILEKSSEHYDLSLKQSDFLKSTSAEEYRDIWIEGKNGRELKPTLYDVLLSRALDFYKGRYVELPRPKDEFTIQGDQFFAPAAEFLEWDVPKADYLSFERKCIRLFQDILAFHAASKNENSFVLYDLQRLSYVHQKYPGKEGDDLYLQALRQIIEQHRESEVSTEAMFELASLYYNQGNEWNPKSKDDENRWKKKEALELCEEANELFPESRGANLCKNLMRSIEEKALHLNLDKVSMTETDVYFLLRYKNLDKVHFRIVEINRDKLVKSAAKRSQRDIQYYTHLDPLREWSVELPDSGDYQSHSIELKTQGLLSGYYVIIASVEKDFRTDQNAMVHSLFWSSDLAHFFKQHDTQHDFFVLNREHGNPQKDAVVEIYEEEYNYQHRGNDLKLVSSFTTDSEGRVAIPHTHERKNYTVLLAYKEDTLVIDRKVYLHGKAGKEKRVLTTEFLTDRKIYRPGQTVYFKVYLMEKLGHEVNLVANQEVELELKDVNRQLIGKTTLQTNESGSAHGSFILPTSALTGTFYIYDGLKSHAIQVEEYKRPSFEVKIVTPRTNLRLETGIEVKGEALTFNGLPVSGAKGRYYVERSFRDISPFLDYYSWRFYPSSEKTIVSQGEFTTDSSGGFSILFEAIPDEKISKEIQPVFRYHIKAFVTDVNNETQEAKSTVNIGYHSLEIRADFEQPWNKEKDKDIQLVSQNLNGEFIPANLKLELIELIPPADYLKYANWTEPDYYKNKEEHEDRAKSVVYNSTLNAEMWQKGEVHWSKTVNTGEEKNVRIENIEKFSSGMYLLKLVSEENGQEISWSRSVELFGESDKKTPLPVSLWAHSLHDEVKVGDKASILLGSVHKNGMAYYVLSNKEGVYEEGWLSLKGGLKKIEIPVREEDRGGIAVQVLLSYEGLMYFNGYQINVPLDHKELTLHLETTRKVLKPASVETWKLKASDNLGNPIQSEVMISMYDKSLDVFGANNWSFDPYHWSPVKSDWDFGNMYDLAYSRNSFFYKRKPGRIKERSFDQLNWFGFSIWPRWAYTKQEDRSAKSGVLESVEIEEYSIPLVDSENSTASATVRKMPPFDDESDEEIPEEDIRPRSNFRELAFFYPELKTDEEGAVEFSFEVPDALTKWKLQALVHTKDLKHGLLKDEFVTRKEIMVQSNYPRFMTVGDTLLFSSKISNISGEDLEIDLSIQLIDPFTGKIVEGLLLNSEQEKMTLPTNGNKVVQWKLLSPMNPRLLEISVFANGKKHRDGESKIIPILTKSVLVTESYPISLRKGEQQVLEIKNLDVDQKALGIQAERFTFEFTPNPIWYVVQALPYLDEISNESTGQLFNRYFANSIGTYIAHSDEKIEKIFSAWKNLGEDAFESKLAKNPELKNIILSESPWLREANKEEEDKKKVGMFFDKNNMNNRLSTALFELMELQSPNGGWPWFSGMKDNRFITQNIVMGMGRLRSLGILEFEKDQRIRSALEKAVLYMDARMKEDYDELLKRNARKEEYKPSSFQIQYLFARSYFKEMTLSENHKEAYNYYMNQAKKFWLENGKYFQAMLALTAQRDGDEKFAEKVIASLQENAIHHKEFGMYWKSESGYYWHQSDIARQAMIIEAFDEIAGDVNEIDEMKVWLLKQKQTKMWKTGRGTTEACFALLTRGSDLISKTNQIEVSIGEQEFILPSENPGEAGTSYVKLQWERKEISNDMKTVKAENKGASVSWGAVYYQYFQDSDKIRESSTSLSIERKFFRKSHNAEGAFLEKITGSHDLKTGDVLVVRMVIKSDRDLEFVHLKDMRAAGLEPVKNISGYRWQDGAGYYLSIRDASTNYYFESLKKGTYVLEYELKADNAGDFTSGIATIQSFYAPEFSAHSRGIRLHIKQ